MKYQLTQKERLFSLLIDLSIVILICKFAFGTFIPPLGDKGFWFFTSVLSILVGSKLITPFYIKPADAISYAVPAFIALMLINNWPQWTVDIRVSFTIVSLYTGLIILLGGMAIIFNNWGNEKLQSISNNLRIILDFTAKPQVIYTIIAFYAIYAYHSTKTNEIMLIGLAVFLTVAFSFGDFILRAYNRLGAFKENKFIGDIIGEVVAYQQPSISLVRQFDNKSIKPFDILYAKDKQSSSKLIIALDYVGRDEGILVRTVEIASLVSQDEPKSTIQDKYVTRLNEDFLNSICEKNNIEKDNQINIVGIVAPDTSIERLYFEVVNDDDLEEGRLVSVTVSGKKVLYQILAGLTKEEAVHKKNTYGYLRAQAQQIGIWNHEKDKFIQCHWLPNINTPVYLEKQESFEITSKTIGHFPSTNYQIKLGNIHQMVTHNTAILGILGVGKSMLAIELLERMMTEGIKVICLDLTNQYAQALQPFYDSRYEEQRLEILKQACDQDRDAWNNSPEDGGSLPNLKNAMFSDLNSFLDEESTRMLKIYNPTEFVATRQNREPSSFQSGGQWQRGAALFSVTPVEVTQIVSEMTLEILSNRMSDSARVCLVYEEAHSLVPEWNSVVSDGDKNATSGSARAILQGRKFGLGCLLITQRTANVTKTILNQCNTIFAMRTFDETGKDFLSNYIGRDYSNTLSTIPERHAVFYGRASSCENPVLIKLNDRENFVSCFREEFPPPALPVTENNNVEANIEDSYDVSF